MMGRGQFLMFSSTFALSALTASPAPSWERLSKSQVRSRKFLPDDETFSIEGTHRHKVIAAPSLEAKYLLMTSGAT